MGKIRFIFLAGLFLCSCTGRASQKITLTWAVGKDVTGTQKRLAGAFMAQNPQYNVRLIEMPESASLQHDSYVTYFIARDPTVDIYSIDIIWPAEFAAAGWILSLDDYFPESLQSEFLPGPVEGCRYQGKVFAVPWFTDAGLLYYRSDLVRQPPESWDELVRQAKTLQDQYHLRGFVMQAAQYEGLICNYLEYLWSLGGEIADAQGNVSVESPEAEEALKYFFDLIHTYKVAPPDVLTFKEEESREAFTAGRSVFLRNWPYVWKIAQNSSTSKVEGKVALAPLPGKGISCLGGWNLAVSRFSRRPRDAWRLIEFMTSAAAQKEYAISAGRLPTRKSVYQDAAVLKAAPHLKTLYPVFQRARPRPANPRYAKISDILQVEIHRVLTRQQGIKEALKRAQEKISKITKE